MLLVTVVSNYYFSIQNVKQLFSNSKPYSIWFLLL